MTRFEIKSALHAGIIVRARRNVYLSPQCPADVLRAQRVGGRLDCVSIVALHGVFVLERARLHVQISPTHGRLRSPESRTKRLGKNHHVTVHWRETCEEVDAHSVHLIAALVQAVLCQPPRAAIATLDSALHVGVIGEPELAEVFALLPQNRQFLRAMVDGRAEAGSESMARLMLRGLGCEVEVQKKIDGVGRVDLVVDGWLVIECDSREFHGGWKEQEADRARDLALAARGYTVIRPTAHMIFSHPEVLLAAVRGLRRSRLLVH